MANVSSSFVPSPLLLRSPERLRPYQQEAIDFLYEHDCAALLLKMGAGKTVITATALAELLAEGVIQRAIIFAPPLVADTVWPLEFRSWTHLTKVRVALARGTPTQRLAAVCSTAQVVLSNYENIQWFADNGLFEGFDAVVFDELTKLKNPQGKRFKAMRKAIRGFRIRWGLTGTTADKLEDVYAQFALIDDGAALGRTWTAFRETYFYRSGPMAWQWEPKHDAVRQVSQALRGLVYQIPQEAYEAQLPPIVNVPVPVVLPEPLLKQYAKFERDTVMMLKDETVTTANAGVLTNKLQQFGQGFMYDEKGETWGIHTDRQRALFELVSDLNRQALIIYKYKADLAMLREIWPDLPFIGDGCRPVDAHQYIMRWNEGLLPRLALHPMSAGHGLNLQAGGNTIIWFALTWSRDEYDQVIARLRRPGQAAEQVWNYLLYAPGTVDEAILATLESKLSLREAIEEGMRRRSNG